MPVSLSIQSNFTLDEDLSQFEATVNEWIMDGSNDVQRQVIPGMLNELRTQPGRPKYPIRWASPDQKLYVLILLRKQARARLGRPLRPDDDISYQRTGATAAAWDASVSVTDNQMTMIVSNSAPASEFVYGSLNQRSRNEALSYQQPFHQDTGWQLAVDTVAFWEDAALEIMDTAVSDGIEDFVKRTTRRRSKQL